MKFSFKKAKKAQEVLKEKIKITPLNRKVKTVAGCDLTFIDPFKNPTIGIGAFVVLTYPELEVIDRVYEVAEVEIPYVPGFLAFRELPLLLKTFRKLKTEPDVVFVDGHGITHPRGLGIAAHFGVVTGIPTVGCAKKPLFGEFKEPCREAGCYEPILHPKTKETLGYAVRLRKNSKPVYISPGNLITPEEALQLAFKTAKGFKLPEPTRLAHNYLQTVRKGIIHRKFKEPEGKNGS